jgi:Fe-S cluster biogenesis protein NfuA
MASGRDAQAAGERVESLLAELRSNAGPEVAATAEELVTCLVELYGAGLAEVLRILGEDAEAGPRLINGLVADPLVESLLLIHDLHPLDTGSRIQRALGELGSQAGEVEYLGIDDQGVVHLRLEKSGHGCGSSAAGGQEAVEKAVTDAAPDITGVSVEVVEPVVELPLLQIGRGPTMSPAPIRSSR